MYSQITMSINKIYDEVNNADGVGFAKYVSKRFYHMNHLFQSESKENLIKVNEVDAGTFAISDTQLYGAMHAIGERRWQDIRTDNANLFVIWITLEGNISIIHNGNREEIGESNYTMTWSKLPHRGKVVVGNSGRYRALMVSVSSSYVTSLFPRAHDVAGGRFTINTAGARLARYALELLAENPEEFSKDEAQNLVASAVYSLLLPIANGPDRTVEAESLKESRATEVISFIDRHLADSSLTAGKIGAGCSMSSRYVHSLLRQRGTSLRDYVWRRRYEAAHERISDPRFASETIGSIALALGFQSNAHFSTGFRKTFGQSPSQVRKSALCDDSGRHIN
jgi:AraC-like DNA-binding protein